MRKKLSRFSRILANSRKFDAAKYSILENSRKFILAKNRYAFNLSVAAKSRKFILAKNDKIGDSRNLIP